MIIAILILGLLGCMIALTFRYCSNWLLYHEKIKHYAHEYEKALRGTDKEYARKIGHTYYSTLRRGPLTQEDLEAIDIDLEMMN